MSSSQGQCRRRRLIAAFAWSVPVLIGLAPARPARGQPPVPPDAAIVVRQAQVPQKVLAYRRSLIRGRPGFHGFKAPILEDAEAAWPIDLVPQAVPQPLREAADLVARRLPSDGLPITLARVIAVLGPDRFTFADSEAIEMLWMVGLPTDLLPFFQPQASSGEAPWALVSQIGRRLASGETVESLRPFLAASAFRFQKSRPDFRVATESGEHALGLIRLQIPEGRYWRGPGDGGAVDMVRQFVTLLPNVPLIAGIEEDRVNAFLSIARKWPYRRPAQLTLLVEPVLSQAENGRLTQWAQDNGKAGLVGSAGDGTLRPATLVPRYANRSDLGSVFQASETFLFDTLAATGHTVIQSPLLFQGGNLLAVRDPVSGDRILLAGEAEIDRNTILGLTDEQAVEAIRIEFGADRCVVLPTVSFHIDFELCVRAEHGRLTAFVNDTAAAVRMILTLGIDALDTGGTLDKASAQAAKEHLASGRDAAFLDLVVPRVAPQTDENGYFQASLAAPFGVSAQGSAAGNLQRFLLALDLLSSMTYQLDELPPGGYFRSYIRALKERNADRQALHRQLRDLGWRVVGVPSLGEGDRSINYLNGIHGRRRYLIPAYGGFYAPLDRAAQAAFSKVLGDAVEIVPISSGASQRKYGAIHCSAAAYPLVENKAGHEQEIGD